MNASDAPMPEKPEKRDITGFLKALILSATLAATAQESEAAVAKPHPEDRNPSGELALRLAKARTVLTGDQQSGPAALFPGTGESTGTQEMWWRNWGNWRPGWGNGGWRNVGWGNGGWRNGGWNNWRNWRNF